MEKISPQTFPFRNAAVESLGSKEFLFAKEMLLSDYDHTLVGNDVVKDAVTLVLSSDMPRQHAEKLFNSLIFVLDHHWIRHRVRPQFDTPNKPLGEPQYLHAGMGTSLSLHLPILLYYGLTDTDLKKMAEKCNKVALPGAKEYVTQMKKRGIPFGVITTSWKATTQHTLEKLGMPVDFVVGTELSLDSIRSELIENMGYFRDQMQGVKFFIQEAASHIKDNNDVQLYRTIADFYIRQLQVTYDTEHLSHQNIGTLLGRKIGMMHVVTRQTKPRVIEGLTRYSPNMFVTYTGDGVNDDEALRYTKSLKTPQGKKRGVAIAINAERVAIEQADIALATSNMEDLLLLQALLFDRGVGADIGEVVRELQDVFGSKKIQRGGNENIDDIAQLSKLRKQEINGLMNAA